MLFCFFEILEFFKSESNVVATVLFDVKINENRHEEEVKVAGCSFRSLRRSNILVFTGFDLYITGAGSGEGWVVTLYLVPYRLFSPWTGEFTRLDFAAPSILKEKAGYSCKCHPRKA